MLERHAGRAADESWFKAHAGAVIALGAGAISLIVAMILKFKSGAGPITGMPNPAVTLPLLGVALIGAGRSVVKHESWRALALAGVGMAVAALIIGWLVVAFAVIAGAALVGLIIAKFL